MDFYPKSHHNKMLIILEEINNFFIIKLLIFLCYTRKKVRDKTDTQRLWWL